MAKRHTTLKKVTTHPTPRGPHEEIDPTLIEAYRKRHKTKKDFTVPGATSVRNPLRQRRASRAPGRTKAR